MSKDYTLTAERLREALDYDPKTGDFHWKIRRRGHTSVGDLAGGPSSNGYWRIKVDQERIDAHRLAWLYVHGEWPTNEIDHRNTNRRDNRIANLRDVTAAQNNQNTHKPRSVNGYIGVSRGTRGRWRATITTDSKQRYLGDFDTREEAAAVYLAAKAELHPFWFCETNPSPQVT